jgi:hypothetical protein
MRRMFLSFIMMALFLLVGFDIFAQEQPAQKRSTEFDGEWQGRNTGFSKGCGTMSYNLTVKDSLISGNARYLDVLGGSTNTKDSAVTGEVAADGTAEIRVKGPARISQFSGKFTSTEFRGVDPPKGNRGCSYEIELKRK